MPPDPRVILDESGELPRVITGDRAPGETSGEPTPEPGDPEPHPDADTTEPVMQDRRKPR